MRIALLSDIHGNRQALEACLAHAAGQAAERLVFLGDLVGYGADPAWVVARVAEAVGRGALALLGNHDEAVLAGGGDLNPTAAAAVDWTRGRLDAAALGFLRGLPLVIEEEDRLFVHADASAPDAWHYVLDADAALRSLEATGQRLTFCGHTHLPRLFGITAASKLMSFQPVAGVPVPLRRPRHWLAVLGAVGQPRDGNPAACYGIFDTKSQEMSWQRVPYDVEAAAAAIRAAGLPDSLATRLYGGR
jgi:diadenosine tetraphosphatase ApaH/serine/threonine PP2A family protein phosphatase